MCDKVHQRLLCRQEMKLKRTKRRSNSNKALRHEQCLSYSCYKIIKSAIVFIVYKKNEDAVMRNQHFYDKISKHCCVVCYVFITIQIICSNCSAIYYWVLSLIFKIIKYEWMFLIRVLIINAINIITLVKFRDWDTSTITSSYLI